MRIILNILLGDVSSGKTSYCINEALKRKEKGLKSIIITLEQYTLEYERKIIDSSEDQGLLDIEVLSFQRLAYNFFEKNGQINKKIIDDTTKIMLIKKILLDNIEELKFYKKMINKQGFIDNISALFKEFYQYNFTLEKIDNLIQTFEENDKHNTSVYNKMVDLRLIYSKYNEYINKDYLEADNVLNILSKQMVNSSQLENINIYIDNFVAFSNAELNVIKNLLKIASNVTITLPIDIKNINGKNQYSYYYLPQKTYYQLLKLSEETEAVTEVISLENRKIKNEELQFLKENYFISDKKYNKKVDNIKIYSNLEKYEETKNIAYEIKRLVVNKNYRYKDIAIITGNIDEYENIINAEFKKLDIPVFIDKKRNVLSHQIVEFIRSLLDVVISNWSYESVFRFLKTGILKISETDICSLENYILQYGIRGYKWRLDKWQYGFNEESDQSFDDKYSKIKINDLKDNIISIVDLFAKGLKFDSKDTILNFSKKIFDVLYAINIEEKIYELTLYTEQNEITHLLDVHIKTWNKLCSMFDEMVNILGDEEVTLIEFKNILESGLYTVEVGLIPQTQDQVILGNISRTKISNKKAVILIGCNDGNIPELNQERKLITDDDIYEIEKNWQSFLEKSEYKNLSSHFLVYDILLKATEKLIFSFSNSTIAGKTLLPSSVIYKIEKMFDIKRNIINKGIDISPKYLIEDIGDILNKIKKEELIGDYEIALLNWAIENEQFKDDIIKVINANDRDLKNEKLSIESINKLYGKEIVSSVTKLEKYVSCPFAYFVQYNLEIKERKLFEITNIDFGNLFHNVLEKFINEVEIKKTSYDNITKEDISNFIEKNIDEMVKNIAGEVFFDTERNKYFIVRVKRISKKSLWALVEHIKAGDFKPAKAEVEFSNNKIFKGITINLNNSKKLVITGKVDRIDICTEDGKNYVKVLDYKSSKKSLDLSDIYYGTQLQLITYLDIILKNSEELFKNNEVTESGGMFYFNIHDPIIKDDEFLKKIMTTLNHNESLTDTVINELDNKMLNEFKLSGMFNSDIDVIKKMDKNMTSDSNIINASFKKDFTLKEKSRKDAVDNDTFDLIRRYCYNKIELIGNEIVEGKISVNPIKSKNYVSCTYCKYRSICLIDTVKEENKYNELKKMTKDETLLLIQKELGNDE